MNQPIDIVIPWVDGSDPEWKKKYNVYSNEKGLKSPERYRDYGTLRYVLRSIEKYASWVHSVYLVTDGQVPEWLNKNYKKLKLISHSDYIDDTFLPTFNSNTIENNIFRIKSLSNNFILFNDDTLLNGITQESDFFVDNKPCDSAILSPVFPTISGIDHIVMNDLSVLNYFFSKKKVVRKNILNFYNSKYGILNLKNILLSPYSAFCGFYDFHMPVAYNKSIYKSVFQLDEVHLNEISRHRFRSTLDINHWLVRYWQFCTNNFHPRRISFGKYLNIDNLVGLSKALNSTKIRMICVNDKDVGSDYDEIMHKINSMLSTKFPEKSSFEM